jgi:hypothetical protein
MTGPDGVATLSDQPYPGPDSPSRRNARRFARGHEASGITRSIRNSQSLIQNTVVAGKNFTLLDDDDFNEDDGFLVPDGDEGESLTDPDLSLIHDRRDNGVCDNCAANAFGAAYVCPVYVGTTGDVVPFVLNVPTITGHTACRPANAGIGAGSALRPLARLVCARRAGRGPSVTGPRVVASADPPIAPPAPRL